MANTEKLNVDAYVLDSLMPDLVGHDRKASAFVVYLFLWRKTRGGARSAVLSHRMVADGTGLAKRSAQAALERLVARELIQIRRAGPTAAATVTLSCHWRR